MRNAIILDENTVMTIDNTGCVGEKDLDVVFAPNSITAAFCLRTAILEQWAAGAMPKQIVVANFTGDNAWEDYINGFQTIYDEIGEPLPPISGSSESNFPSLQSALSVTVIGKKQFTNSHDNVDYYIIGKPLIGKAVLEQADQVAKLREIYECLQKGFIKAIWPCGSKGIQHEVEQFTGHQSAKFDLDGTASAGPSTAIVVAVDRNQIDKFHSVVSAPITPVQI